MSKRPKKQAQLETSNEPLQPLLTIEDVTQMLQISRPTLYTLFHEGLPFMKFGKAVRIAPSSLQRFLAQCERIG